MERSQLWYTFFSEAVPLFWKSVILMYQIQMLTMKGGSPLALWIPAIHFNSSQTFLKVFFSHYDCFILKKFKKDWFLLLPGVYDLCVSPGVMYMSERALRNQVWIFWSGVTGSCELMNIVLGLKFPSVPKEHHVAITTELVSWGLLWICSPTRPPAQHPPTSASGALGL